MFATILPFVFSLIDRFLPDEAARQAAKLEIMKAENQQALQEMQASLSAILVEAGSTDPWTSRARPAFLYVMYAIIILCVVGGIVGVWFPGETNAAASGVSALLKALPPELYNLFGLGYLGYTGARSFDKWQKK